jgi:hypothetical protein
MIRLRRPLLAAVLLTAPLAGCSGSDKASPPPATTSASQTAPPSESPSPTAMPADALAALARRASEASYTARYTLDRTTTKTPPARFTVYRTGRSLRVDVISGSATATLITTPKGSYSCRAARGEKTCFLIAGAGKPIPKLFDAGLQQVFTGYLQRLAQHAGDYSVTDAGTTAATTRLPAARCFDVTATSTTPKPTVANGRYCLAATGIVTSVTYPTGTLRLTAITAPPTPRILAPYANPTPLPG